MMFWPRYMETSKFLQVQRQKWKCNDAEETTDNLSNTILQIDIKISMDKKYRYLSLWRNLVPTDVM